MEKICPIHGLAGRYVDSRKGPNSTYWRCKKCHIDAVKKRRKQNKLELVEYCGGACADCGLRDVPEVFDFHHLDPASKEFTLGGAGGTFGMEKLKREVDKCVMLCANCHRRRHAAAV